ncbi:MAG: ZIP family metal transporter [Bacillota bacterium]|nr:ZIP family metal transporter [Bacillota bacterium]MDI7249081.1 ZIP family metal transporter [Bacillota bacterium]
MTLAVAAAAGLAIALGGLVPALFRGKRWPSTLLLGLAGGAVLGIVGLEVLPAARERGSLFTLAAGVATGVALMGGLHLVLDSHGHRGGEGRGGEGRGSEGHGGEARAGEGLCPVHGQERWLRAGFLTWLAVAVHNVLDGFGIGAGFGESGHLGMALAAAVAIHNLPVGMLVATPLVLGEAGGSRVVLNTALAGMCTPLGALLGESLAGLSPVALAASLGLAGGSLLFILSELLHMSWCESPVLTVVGGSAGALLTALGHVLGGH